MRGLTLVVAGPDPARLRAALGLACAAAALGGRARLFLDAAAAPLLPSLPAEPLWPEALDLGVEVGACQGGLATAGLTADAVDPAVRMGGLVGLLGSLGEDRLAVV